MPQTKKRETAAYPISETDTSNGCWFDPSTLDGKGVGELSFALILINNGEEK
jgi:hypothetical protein